MSKYNGTEYAIDLKRKSFPWTEKTVKFTIGSTQTKTITGLVSGEEYTVRIRNAHHDFTGTSYYLVGSGSIN